MPLELSHSQGICKRASELNCPFMIPIIPTVLDWVATSVSEIYNFYGGLIAIMVGAFVCAPSDHSEVLSQVILHFPDTAVHRISMIGQARVWECDHT